MNRAVFALASLFLAAAGARASFPAMFVFGDSLLDAGNNNRLFTVAKADYPPYGIDFPGGPTGRFCNGRTVVDHLGELLGLPLIPPFNSPATGGPAILHGVNYASAGSGILHDTGNIFGCRFPMDEQIEHFKGTVEELSSQMGEAMGEFLGRSLFVVAAGSNDYIHNYLLPFSGSRSKYHPDAFARLLIRSHRRQIENLYRLGGRKFLIGGLAPLGCTPHQIALSGKNTSGCVDEVNRLALQFNAHLGGMLRRLEAALHGSRFVFWDAYSYGMHVFDYFPKYGFKFPYSACCGGGRAGGKTTCLPVVTPRCWNRSEYVFWDMFHPSDALNGIAAGQLFRHLARLS